MGAVQRGSFSKAAVDFNVDVSTVSEKIKELELCLGEELVTRSKSGVKPTWLGVKAFSKASSLIEEFDTLIGTFSSGKDAQKVRIAAPTSLSSVLLKWIGEYQKESAQEVTGVEIESYPDGSKPDLWSYDFALIVGDPPNERLVATALGTYKRILCASTAFLHKHEKINNPCDLLSLPLIAVTRGVELFKFGNQSVSLRIDPAVRVVNAFSMLASAESSLGIAVGLPEIIAIDAINHNRLVRVLPNWHIPERPVWILRKPSRERKILSEQLIHWCNHRWNTTEGLTTKITN